jgi:hypothetical protein
MSKCNPMRRSRKPSAHAAAKNDARVARHTVVIGATAAGKSVYDLLRMTQKELRRVRRKPADGQGDAGEEAWA